MKMPVAATRASSTETAAAEGMQHRDRREQRRARDVAHEHRASGPEARGDRSAQKPSTPTGTTSAMITQVICCGDPVVRSTNQGSASQVICVPSDEITSAASNAATRLSRSRFTARLSRRTRRRPGESAGNAAAELVEQLLEALAELFEFARESVRAWPTTSVRRGASVGEVRAHCGERYGNAAAAARRVRRGARPPRARPS